VARGSSGAKGPRLATRATAPCHSLRDNTAKKTVGKKWFKTCEVEGDGLHVSASRTCSKSLWVGGVVQEVSRRVPSFYSQSLRPHLPPSGSQALHCLRSYLTFDSSVIILCVSRCNHLVCFPEGLALSVCDEVYAIKCMRRGKVTPPRNACERCHQLRKIPSCERCERRKHASSPTQKRLVSR